VNGVPRMATAPCASASNAKALYPAALTRPYDASRTEGVIVHDADNGTALVRHLVPTTDSKKPPRGMHPMILCRIAN